MRRDDAHDWCAACVVMVRSVTVILALAMGSSLATRTWAFPAASGTDADADAGQLQEIVVTSQKRSEDIKDIPFSVSAIGGEQLLQHHVADYDDITRTVPGVAFQAGAGPGLDNIEIRGVSSTSGSATVGIYIDEVSVTTKNTYDGAVQPKLFDLDRIEVLRGPQGTLYGASSMGGTICFITKQPDLGEFSAIAATDLSDTHHGGFNDDAYAVLNVPVVAGVFALRIGVDFSTQSGYIDRYGATPTGAGPNGSVLTLATNDSTGILAKSGVNDVHTEVVRIVGKYAGPDEWTLTPAFLWQRTNSEDSSIFYPSIGLYRVQDGTYYNSNIFANFTLLGASGAPQTPATSYATQTVLGFLASPVFYDTHTEQFSEEIRLSSRSTSIAGIPVTWTAGLYFSNQDQVHTDDEFIPGLQNAFRQIYGYDINTSAVGGLGPNGLPGVSYANDLIYQAGVIQYPSVNSVQEGYTVRPLTIGVTASFRL